MKYISLYIASSLAPLALAKSAGQLCRGTQQFSEGNWYCAEVQAITYKNISQAGEYNRTTGVNPETGLCEHEPVSYSGRGSLTPLIGELSMHLRGPMNVSQLAVYTLSAFGSSNKSRSSTAAGTVQGPSLRKRTYDTFNASTCSSIHNLTTTVVLTDRDCTAGNGSTIESKTISSDPVPLHSSSANIPFSNSPFPTIPDVRTFTTSLRTRGSSVDYITFPRSYVSSPTAPGVRTVTRGGSTVDYITSRIPEVRTITSHGKTIYSTVEYITSKGTPEVRTVYSTSRAEHLKRAIGQTANTSTPEAETLTIASSPDTVVAAAAAWNRIAYYTSNAPAQATGLAFLANLGDPRKSGTFDYAFGNSLGYVMPDGSKVAPESMPFDGTLETSEVEIAVFSDKECDGDCEYSRPEATAHYGWSGEAKAFLIEFQMDHYDNVGSDQGMLSDAPAWWFLNAAIPRILQYGNDRNNIPCSCWSTGCGEFDAFEILSRGEERAKSTIHRQGNLEGGDSNYFRRPVGRMLKFAVVFWNYNITAVVLDDEFDFSRSLDMSKILDMIEYSPDSDVHSLFAIGS